MVKTTCLKKIIVLTLLIIISTFTFAPSFSLAEEEPVSPAPAVGGEIPPPTQQEPVKSDKSPGLLYQMIGGFASGVVESTLNIVAGVLGTVFSPLIYIEGAIIDYLLNPSAVPIVNANIVRIGWPIVRDIANLLFILVLLIMAIATILRLQTYAAQQLFAKLIIAALLINFSLIIGGFVIDFTQFFTKFFWDQITGGGDFVISLKLANALKLTNFYKASNNPFVDIANATWLVPAGIILNLIALVVTVFVFGATVIFLIMRVGHLWLLLVFAPMAWLSWILPDTRSYFKKWWSELFHWSFFAPIYTFMIFLSLSLFDGAGNLIGMEPANPTWNQSANLFKSGAPAAIFQFILAIFLMFMSLVVAKKFSIEGSSGAVNTLTGWGQKSLNWTGRRLRRTAVEATKPLEPQAAGAPPPSRFRRFGAAIGGAALRTPGLRQTYTGLLQAEAKAYQDVYGQYKNVEPAVRQQILRSGMLDPRTRLAVQQAAIEKGEFAPTADEMRNLIDQAKKYAQTEKFLSLTSDLISKGRMTPNAQQLTNFLDRSSNYFAQEAQLLQAASEKLIEEGKISNANELLAIVNRASRHAAEQGKLLETIAKNLGEKGKMDTAHGFTPTIITDLIQRAKTRDKAKEFTKLFPVLGAQALGKTVEEIVEKIEDASDIYTDQLRVEVVRAMTPKQLKNIGSKGDSSQRLTVEQHIQGDFLALSAAEVTEIQDVMGTRNKRLREEKKSKLPPALRRLLTATEITTTPKWEHNI